MQVDKNTGLGLKIDEIQIPVLPRLVFLTVSRLLDFLASVSLIYETMAIIPMIYYWKINQNTKN